MKNNLIYFFGILLLFACSSDNEGIKNNNINPKENVVTPIVQKRIEKPSFNADSAYLFVKQQVDFGPRVPNTDAHTKCAKYLENKLKSYNLNVIVQQGKVTTFNNKTLNIKNIVGEYNPDAEKRILLFSHWDSRPFADQDTKDRTKPILGANDGASGVGILLEIARQLSIEQPAIGVDIIFFDAEDYGQPSSGMTANSSESWCLGSQYWAKNPHKENYKAEYGILLDMVGNANPVFTKERISMNYAPNIVEKVWKTAAEIGYGNYFVNQETYFVGTDDHKYVNEIAGIPSIDIIHYNRQTKNFHSSWHTHNDNMNVIEKSTLAVVGETLLATIYNEN